MISKLTQIVAIACMALGLTFAQADDKNKDHEHDKVVAGPMGGRLLETKPARAEFFVQKDRKVAITFYDKNLKPIAPKDQVVNVIAEPKSGKAKLQLEKQGDSLISKTALPEGDGYNIVVQVRENAEAKPKNFRIHFEDYECGGCKRVEYACTCDE